MLSVRFFRGKKFGVRKALLGRSGTFFVLYGDAGFFRRRIIRNQHGGGRLQQDFYGFILVGAKCFDQRGGNLGYCRPAQYQ